jgi:hypothetical protein
MERRKPSILGVLNQCRRECAVAAKCFQLAAPADASRAEVYAEAMGFRADHAASELTALEHVETIETTSLSTGEPVEFAVLEARYEVPTGGEVGRPFFVLGITLQN